MEKEIEAEKGAHPAPSAPPTAKSEPPPVFGRSSSRQQSILARGINSECVICMDRQVCTNDFVFNE